MVKMDKILFVITTYNQLEYTKLCINSLSKIKDCEFDILVIDDNSTDETVEWCKQEGIKVIEKDKGYGCTHSWNVGYKYFKENEEYKYYIVASNDILVPDGALTELVDVFEKWPFSLVAPMSSVAGAGHNGPTQGIENIWPGTPPEWVNDSAKYQSVQVNILSQKKVLQKQNNLYILDPVRMKMFNGFFFMMNRYVINYEREDGLLFDPEKIMYKSEDEFNWSQLIPNDDFAAVCKTAFIYHYKGMSTKTQGYSDAKNDIDKFNELRNKGE